MKQPILPGGTHFKSEKELEFLFHIIRSEKCRRVLEIGSGYGRMLLRLPEAIPKGSEISSIDLPNSNGWQGRTKPEEHLKGVIQFLCSRGFDAQVFFDNSRSEKSQKWAHHRGPFDLIYIDAEHTEDAVLADFKTYSPMTRLVAFHDVNKNNISGRVHVAYKKLCEEHKHMEFIECQKSDVTPGIGVIWMNEHG